MQADVCVVSMLSRLHKHKVCLSVWHMKNKAAVRIRGAPTSLFRSFCVIFSVTLLPLVLFPFFSLYFSYPFGVPLSIVSDLSSSCLSFFCSSCLSWYLFLFFQWIYDKHLDYAVQVVLRNGPFLGLKVSLPVLFTESGDFFGDVLHLFDPDKALRLSYRGLADQQRKWNTYMELQANLFTCK
jgi:hypothetical protein